LSCVRDIPSFGADLFKYFIRREIALQLPNARTEFATVAQPNLVGNARRVRFAGRRRNIKAQEFAVGIKTLSMTSLGGFSKEIFALFA